MSRSLTSQQEDGILKTFHASNKTSEPSAGIETAILKTQASTHANHCSTDDPNSLVAAPQKVLLEKSPNFPSFHSNRELGRTRTSTTDFFSYLIVEGF